MIRKARCVLLMVLAVLVSGVQAAEIDDGIAESGDEDKRFDWKLSAQFRLRGEWRDNFDLNDDVDDTSRVWFSRVRVGFDMTIQKDWGLFVQAQDSRVYGQEASTASNEQNLDLHQGYADLWRNHTWSVRVGRQEWAYGNERLVGAFNWDNVGRSFDGARVRYKHDSFMVDGLLAEVANRPNGTGGSIGSQLYGIYVQNPATRKIHWEGYWLEFTDHLAMPGELGDPGNTRVDALGGRGVYRSKRVDAELELVYETGRIDGDPLEAWAGAVNGGYTFGQAHRTRVFAGYDYATGDDDPTDGEREEFFNFFPTNHKHYGYIDFAGWRNLRSYYGGARHTWGKHWAQAKFHQISLESRSGPWKSAGGAVLGFDPTGTSSRSVGWEIDLNYNWAFRKKSGLQVGYSYFDPKRFAKSTRGTDPQNWAYVMFTIGV